jgi:hypothetical protein
VLSTIDEPDDSLDDEVVQNHLQSRKSAMTAVTDFDVALLPFGRARRTDPADLNPGVATFP